MKLDDRFTLPKHESHQRLSEVRSSLLQPSLPPPPGPRQQQPAGAEVHFGSRFGGNNPSWRRKHGRRRLCPWLHNCCSVTFPRMSVIQKVRETVPGCQTITSKLHHSGLIFNLVPKGSKMFFNLPKPPETICSNTEPAFSHPKHYSILLSCNRMAVVECVYTHMHTLCAHTHSGRMDLWTLTFLPAFKERYKI